MECQGVLSASVMSRAPIRTFPALPGAVFWCTADVGWVTGHSYIVYGPLANGCISVMFEGTGLSGQ